MKTVVLVAPHFLPSFLPSVHRSRLWAYHLEEFGWRPIILTTDPAYYECRVVPELIDLLPPTLEVIRTRALPVRPLRMVGDIAVRSLYWYWRALLDLARNRRFDFLHFTIPASLATLLGPPMYRRFRIPYGIDYIDPWIPETPQSNPVLSKAWFAERVSRICEPIAVRNARLITGINTAYFESTLVRNPHLRSQAITAGMPYGGSERDYEALDRRPRSPFLFDPSDGNLHFIYGGALLPKAFAVLDRLLAGVALLKDRRPEIAKRLRLHFVGTGLYENDCDRGHTVTPFILRHGLAGMAMERPDRIGYLDMLNHLRLSSGILVIGSTEPHYSPSKIYQAVMARRPVFTMLHRHSTAVGIMEASHAGDVLTFAEDALPDSETVAAALERFIGRLGAFKPERINWSIFEAVSARATTRVLAGALDAALDLERRQCGEPR